MPSVARKQLQFRFAGPQAAAALLYWYDSERRDLPWRARKGRTPDPYRVWLSEVMLQQTTVKAVIPFYEAFLARWPNVEALAEASLDDVLAAWAGLGYYSRARNLHKCAKVVAGELGGRFPETEEGLRALPGIGPYTAAAIAAIAFGARATPVDGNIERVVARLFAVATPLMDLGAGLCTPKRPSCLLCPLQGDCAAYARGLESALPARAARPERPVRVGLAFLTLREDGAVLLRRRPEAGLLGGMLEVPSTEWAETLPPLDEAMRGAPVRAEWWGVPGVVSHTFTHFKLESLVYRSLVGIDAALTFWADPQRCEWVPRRDLDRVALPSVMRKIIAHGLREM